MRMKSNRYRKLSLTPYVLGFALVALNSAQVLGDDDGPGKPCNNFTIRGAYGIQMQGTRPVPPPTGGMESVVGVVLRTYDGYGNFEQLDNIKGSVTGIVPDRPGSGTYEVSADCTAITYFQPDPGNPNIVIKEKLVILDNGNEIRSITEAPPPLMVSAVSKRIKKR